MGYIIIIIVLNAIASLVEAYFDARKQKKGEKINHEQSAIVRGIAWAVVSIIQYHSVNDFIGVSVLCVLSFLTLGFEYWLLFDPFHNRFTNRDWWYTREGGFFDSILAGYKMRYLRLSLKVILFIMFLTLQILVYGNIHN